MSAASDHPYKHQPERAFWSRAVSRGWKPADLINPGTVLLKATDKVMSAGSCFAANIVPFLETAGFEYVRTEIQESGDRYGYGNYSAGYGNIYTTRQLRQLLERALGTFKPEENRWPSPDGIIDPFRPGLPYPAESAEEFDLLTASHFAKIIEAVQQADVFIYTLGLTEAWTSLVDGAVYPSCPGTIAGVFDPERHALHNFTAAEVATDLEAALALLAGINPALRVIITVSPVPLVATATPNHVYTATAYSKAALRVACEEVAARLPQVVYFPAYEIVTGPHSDDHFEADLRNVSQKGVQTVMAVLFEHSDLPSAPAKAGMSLTDRIRAAETMSLQLAKRECEEVMMDAGLTSAGNGD
jgi:hypothetical protein